MTYQFTRHVYRINISERTLKTGVMSELEVPMSIKFAHQTITRNKWKTSRLSFITSYVSLALFWANE